MIAPQIEAGPSRRESVPRCLVESGFMNLILRGRKLNRQVEHAQLPEQQPGFSPIAKFVGRLAALNLVTNSTPPVTRASSLIRWDVKPESLPCRGRTSAIELLTNGSGHNVFE